MAHAEDAVVMAAPEAAAVVGSPVHPSTLNTAATLVSNWARAGGSRVACAANVHMLMEAWDNPDFAAQMRSADLAVPDGMPLVWALRVLGHPTERVRGPDLTLHVCRQAEAEGIPTGLYGSSPETLELFRAFLRREFPGLQIACAISPPFRPLSEEEDQDVVGQIRASGARILFVSLGCPKQEEWMFAHRDRLDCVMLGVGAAFDFHAGTVREAPGWMQRAGLEWAFRLGTEPRRLWRRYLKHNPRFLYYFGLQRLGYGR